MKLLHTIGTGAHVMQLDRKLPLEDVAKVAAELAQRDPSVEYAEPDRILTAARDTAWAQVPTLR